MRQDIESLRSRLADLLERRLAGPNPRLDQEIRALKNQINLIVTSVVASASPGEESVAGMEDEDVFNIPPGNGRIYGVVKRNFKPVVNAFVSMGSAKSRTDRFGKYSLPEFPSGRWTIAIWHNYSNFLQRISIYPGSRRMDFEIANLYVLY